jgi:MFS family permease
MAEEWKMDTSRNNLNLDNWYMSHRLNTVELWKIGLIGTVYFIGYIVGSFYFPRLADIYGRKPFVIIGGFMQSICALSLVYSYNFAAIYANMFFIGIASPFLSSIGYNLIIELIPESAENGVNTLLMC